MEQETQMYISEKRERKSRRDPDFIYDSPYIQEPETKKPQLEDIETNDEDTLEGVNIPNPLLYPYTSKLNYIHNIPHRPIIPDTKLSHLKKFHRPYFSPTFNSWELDYFSSGGSIDELTHETLFRNYLIFININTKFIQVYPIKKLNTHGNSNFSLYCLKDMLKKYKITNIRGDDDFSFSGVFQEYLKTHNIKHFFSGSKYTNKNRVVDRVIRTIKDGVGIDRELLLFPSIVQKIVNYYNSTPHSAYKNKFSPKEVQNDYELEGWYIRQQQSKLLKILKITKHTYKPGNILLIHRPVNKTSELFKKRRRNFDELATFIQYTHGNAQVELKTKEVVILPIYYTKFVCNNKNELPPDYKYLLNLSPYDDIN
jgi:hypothetical protein